MLKPKSYGKNDYEKVAIDEWIEGVIEKVEYEAEHEFPVFKEVNGKYIKSGVKVAEAVRLKFKFNNYQYPHNSRYMTFNYGAKSTLMTKYIMPLVENANPDMDFDIMELEGFPVKVMWSEKNGFQSVEVIRPLNGKIVPKIASQTPSDALQQDSVQVNEHDIVETPEDAQDPF